ncbi:MAG: hypothetical protein HKO02_15615, partial [Hyphomonadaceae bacterium]|nr:hypothetical protein [Hyphomonadaceae bacterium]
MSNSDRSEEFDLEAETDEDFGLDEGLVSSDIAAAISNLLADVPIAQAQEFPDGDGNIDIRATSMGNDIVFADVDGVTFISGDLADPFGSGTGGYSPFLSLRDSNQNPLDSDGAVHAFNVDSTSDPLLNDLIFANSRTNAVALSNLVIEVIDGVEFFEIRLDLNEPDSGTDSQLQFTNMTLYYGDGTISSFADLTTATEVWELDGGPDGDLTLQLNDNFSGSGTDDYQIFIPVSLFDGADFSTGYFFLEIEAGSTELNSEFAMEGGFFEFNVQAAGSVSGIKFLDEINIGVYDEGIEGPPADSFIIYVDANEDGMLNFTDDGDGILEFNGDDIILERYTETELDGSYIITGLAEGTYQIREYLPPDSPYEGPTTGDFETVTVIEDTNTVVDPIGNFLPVPDIDITKEVTSVDGSMDPLDFTVDEAGDVIEYQISVTTGTGNVDLTNVVVTDPLLSGAPLVLVSGDDGDNVLELGETWIYDGSYTATQGDINDNGGGNGLIDNTASATSDQVGPVNASAAV